MHLVKGSLWRQIDEHSQEPHHGRPKNHWVRSSLRVLVFYARLLWPDGSGNRKSNTLDYVQLRLITNSKKRSDKQHQYCTRIRAPGVHTGIFAL